MHAEFKLTKNNLENVFFNASNLKGTWFTKDGISDIISFCPNQINFLSLIMKENKHVIYLFLNDKMPFGFFSEDLDLNHSVYLNTMAVIIFNNKFMENLEWSGIKVEYGISITSYYLIDDKIGYWYDNIERKNIWNYRKFWTSKMWAVWIVLKLLLNLVAGKTQVNKKIDHEFS